MSKIELCAGFLDDAARNIHSLEPLEAQHALTLDDAYEIQAASIARRLARGERRVGVKLGFTSRAKMIQMGVHDLIWGRLTDAMRVADGGTVSMRKYVHPRVEPEIAFLLGRPLEGNVSGPEALSAVDAIAPALEIIDSRYRDFKFTLNEVVADNASSSGFVIGPWADPAIAVDNRGMILSIDGRAAQIGSSAAILGSPLRSLVAAARLSAAAGEPLQAGWIVMAGAATSAEWLKAGQYVRLEAECLGSVGFYVEE